MKEKLIKRTYRIKKAHDKAFKKQAKKKKISESCVIRDFGDILIL